MQTWVDPLYQNTTTYIYSPVIFQPAPVILRPVFGADPVNMADGSFSVDNVDLTVGQREPQGFAFNRHYDSNRTNFNLAYMANGWTHNYNMQAVTRSDATAALGKNTPQEMAAFLAGLNAAYAIYTATPTASNPQSELWAVAALIAEWSVDQLTNNAVSITLGANNVQFIRQPDSTFTPSAGVSMTLTAPMTATTGFQLQERHGNTFNFDPKTGQVKTIVDPHGKTMTFTYRPGTTATNLTQVTDGWNRNLKFNYTPTGTPQLTSIGDDSGRTIKFGYGTTYNSQGDLTSVTDPEGKIWSYGYDGVHHITQTLDATTGTGGPRTITQNTYNNGQVSLQNCQGNVLQPWNIYVTDRVGVQKDPQGGRTLFYYDEKHRLTGTLDANGNEKTSVYDGQDHVIQQVTPLGEVTQTTYDGHQNVLSITDPLGHASGFGYDSAFQLASETNFLSQITSFTYNGYYQVQTITKPNVNNDPTKPAVVTFAYNTDGTLYSKKDEEGHLTTYGYDQWGQLSQITYPDSTSSTPDVENLVNSSLGDVSTHKDAQGITTAFQYNNRRQATNITIHASPDNVTQFVYDDCGNLWKTIDPDGNLTSQTYSVTRKPMMTTFPAVLAGTPTITNGYDTRDWLRDTANPLNQIVGYAYDPAGRLLDTTNPLAYATSHGYDNDNHPISVKSPLGASSQTTHFGYDPRGEQTNMTDAANRAVYYNYDANGRLLAITNRNKGVFSSTYYNDGRQWTSQTPLLKTTTRTYSQRGLLNSLTKPSEQSGGVHAGQQTTLTYDARGRLQTLADPVGAATYTYDNNNNLLTHAETSAGVSGQITRAYDGMNRLKSYADANGNVIGYQYDTNGNLTRLTYPGGVKTVAYGYDANNRLISVTDWAGRKTTITHDLVGRVTSITRPNGTVRTNNYDAAGQTVQIQEQTLNGAPAGQSPAPFALFKLSYDEAGRETNEFIAPLPAGYTDPPATNVYDADNRLQTCNSQTVVYDDDGNLTSGPLNSSTAVAHTYDLRNRLTAVAASGTAPALSYGYDAEGNRTALTLTGTIPQTTAYIINPQGWPQVLERIKPDATKTYYVYGLGLLYQVDDSGNTATYHYDSRGSTVAITGDAGEVTDRVEYSAYGATTRRTGSTDTPFLYNGRYGVQTDPNGLLFMSARYYNPYLERFLNADPAGLAAGLNVYAYANGNPISLLDPFGLTAVNESTANDDSGGIRFSGPLGSFSGSYSGNVYTPDSTSTPSAAATVATVALGLVALPEEAGVEAGVAIADEVADVLGAGKAADAVAPMVEDSAPMVQQEQQQQQTQIFRGTIRNSDLAGQNHPVTGIPFNSEGFPDFSSVATKTVQIKYAPTRAGDFKAANEAANLEATPEDYTWHHVEDGTTMQLVPTDIHAATGHTGGRALFPPTP